MIRDRSSDSGWRVAIRIALILSSVQPIAACSQSEPDAGLSIVRAHVPRRPGTDIIVVSFDAMRADVLGVYGYDRPTSPHIDRFAARSLVFDRAYTVAPASPTSFAASWTGMLPTRVFHAWKLASKETLASKLTAAGYQTAAFINNVQVTPERDFQTGFRYFDFHRNDPDEAILESALTWLGARGDEPYFAWIHFLRPHAPYIRRELATHLYDPRYTGPFEEDSGTLFEVKSQRDLDRLKELYDGNVLYSDHIFGRLIEGLETIGALDDAVLILTSDHGEEFWDHGGVQHGQLFEEHTRVPFIVYHPDVRRGARSDMLVSNVDLLPTLLSIAGIEHDGPVDGNDWLALETEPQTVIGVSMTSGKERMVSLRKGRHKLIHHCLPEQTQQLYDLESDPKEQHSLAKAEPTRTRELLSELALILGGNPCEVMTAAVRGVAPTVGLDEESIGALRALGYLEK